MGKVLLRITPYTVVPWCCKYYLSVIYVSETVFYFKGAKQVGKSTTLESLYSDHEEEHKCFMFVSTVELYMINHLVLPSRKSERKFFIRAKAH